MPTTNPCEEAILWIFVPELACKMLALKGIFVRDACNTFDFCIVAIAFVSAVGCLTVLRSMRVLRVLPLLSAISKLRIIIQSRLFSQPSID